MARSDGFVVVLPGEGAVIPGTRITWKATPEQTGGAYAVQEICVMPGRTGPPLHINTREEEAWYILEGELTFTIDEEQVCATAGAFVLVPRGIPHTARNTGDVPVRWLLLVSPPGFSRYFEARGPLPDVGGYAAMDPERLAALEEEYGIQPMESLADLARRTGGHEP